MLDPPEIAGVASTGIIVFGHHDTKIVVPREHGVRLGVAALGIAALGPRSVGEQPKDVGHDRRHRAADGTALNSLASRPERIWASSRAK
jgi:hypothetical protein